MAQFLKISTWHLFHHIFITMVWKWVLKNIAECMIPSNCHKNVMEMWCQEKIDMQIEVPIFENNSFPSLSESSHCHKNVREMWWKIFCTSFLAQIIGKCLNQNNGQIVNNGAIENGPLILSLCCLSLFVVFPVPDFDRSSCSFFQWY